MTILERILDTKRAELEESRKLRPLDEVVAAAAQAAPALSLAEAAGRGGIQVVAEVKKASPSKGVIREDFDPVAIAAAYAGGGAAAISVLTDSEYFQGSLDYLRAIREKVAVPLLRKDFIIDPYQVFEARAAGADAILLILAALSDQEAEPLAAVAEELGMDVLWEVHNIEEMHRVAAFSPRVVGINNRDLKTFEVSLETTRGLLPEVPADAVVISESGFFVREELEMMSDWGVDGFLVGEGLMRADDPGEALRGLLSSPGEGAGA
ncbi:MAG: indole-3-glycerol phosphate synthase TrpC [Planctomycetota bacterium]|nr:indole-3-glycerol phosphate synthase TrpC [Planctomycetota bacterium]